MTLISILSRQFARRPLRHRADLCRLGAELGPHLMRYIGIARPPCRRPPPGWPLA